MKQFLLAVGLMLLVAGCDGDGHDPLADYDLTGQWQSNDASCSGDAGALEWSLEDIESDIEGAGPIQVVQAGNELEVTDAETDEPYIATLSGDRIHWEHEIEGTDTFDGRTVHFRTRIEIDALVLSADRLEVTQQLTSTLDGIRIEIECLYFYDLVT